MNICDRNLDGFLKKKHMFQMFMQLLIVKHIGFNLFNKNYSLCGYCKLIYVDKIPM